MTSLQAEQARLAELEAEAMIAERNARKSSSKTSKTAAIEAEATNEVTRSS